MSGWHGCSSHCSSYALSLVRVARMTSFLRAVASRKVSGVRVHNNADGTVILLLLLLLPVGSSLVPVDAVGEAEDVEVEAEEDVPVGVPVGSTADEAGTGNGSPHQLVPFCWHSAAHSAVALRRFLCDICCQNSGQTYGGRPVDL